MDRTDARGPRRRGPSCRTHRGSRDRSRASRTMTGRPRGLRDGKQLVRLLIVSPSASSQRSMIGRESPGLPRPPPFGRHGTWLRCRPSAHARGPLRPRERPLRAGTRGRRALSFGACGAGLAPDASVGGRLRCESLVELPQRDVVRTRACASSSRVLASSGSRLATRSASRTESSAVSTGPLA